MIKKKAAILNKIERHVEESKYSEALACFSSHLSELLSTPSIKSVYRVIARIPKPYFITDEQKLYYGWLSLAAGNFKSLKWVLAEIDFSKINSGYCKANYLALSAMSLGLSRPEKGLYLTQRALTYFEENDKTIPRANVHYNYARQLEACNLFYTASTHYHIAAEIFDNLNCDYFAILSYTGEALSKCFAGKYNEVINECNALLDNRANDLWDVLKLPMAICYYQLNMVDKSLELLLSIKKSIRKLPIISFRILFLEYSFRVFRYKGMSKEINDLLYKIKTSKSYQNNKEIKQLIATVNIENDFLSNGKVSKSNMKNLEMVISSIDIKAPFFVTDCLFKLKLDGTINGLKIDYFTDYFNRARDIGNAGHVQCMALYLADIYKNKGDNDKAIQHLEIALKVYHETGAIVNFVIRELGSLDILKELDEELYNKLISVNRENLCFA